jgi:hypothetical protein
VPRNKPTPPGPFIGVAGLAVLAFLYGYVALAAPGPVTSVVLPLVWIVLFVLACRWFTRRPTAVALLPLLAAVVWFAALLGPTLLGQA